MKKIILFLVMALALTTSTLFAQVPSYVPTSGLLAYYPFNGNANDESGNGNNGTNNGATLTTDRFGSANSGYYFSGLNCNTRIDAQINSTTISNTNEFSISLWVNKIGDGCMIQPRILEFFSPDNVGAFQISLDVSGLNTLMLEVGSNLSSITSLTYQDTNWLNQWNHLLITCTNNNLSLFFNGILVNSTNFSGLPRLANNVAFGRMNHPLYNTFNGKIDDIGIWNRALTQQEITNIYNSSLPQTACLPANVPTTGLVGYWPFCGNANDESGNGNNGTNNGATLTADRFGNANSAYEFNMNYIKVNNSSIYNFNDNLSINVWYKISDNMGAITSNTVFVSKHEAASLDSSYILYNENNCGPSVYQTDVNGNIGYIRNSSFCDTSSWHMLTLTFNNPNMTMYLDGIYYSTISANSINQTTLPLVFGGANNSSNQDDIIGSMKGKLDDIGIWNRALTQGEITNLYNANQCITNITVTDTLIINVGQLSFNDPVTWANNITIAPNPASSQININFNNITNLNGGTLKIINSLGQEVATTPITTSGTNSTMQLATWGGTGMYFVQIINPQGKIVDIKKIILQ